MSPATPSTGAVAEQPEARPVGTNALRAWQRSRLRGLRDKDYAPATRDDVTVVAYFFWPSECTEERFPYLESALYETWRCCGLLPTKLVVNEPSPPVEAFLRRHRETVSLDVAPSLVPGAIHTMSIDCISELHRRFDTRQVLIVQDDGFPIRPGLGEFVGRWDFVGAPYVRDTWLRRTVCSWLRCWTSNGGFSLRTKRICELAAEHWRRSFHDHPQGRALSEDIYYTETLPLRKSGYRHQIRIADAASAREFSYDAVFPFAGDHAPFGFHGAPAFEWLLARGWIPGEEEANR